MGIIFPLTLILVSISFTSKLVADQDIKSPRLLDLVIRDYTFQTYGNNFKTGKFHSIHLPSNLSGIQVDTIRFRCGSLTRYGAKIKEFYLTIGVTLQPCVERVLIVRTNLGEKWSSTYYANYMLDGYQLISPVLGLLAYNAGDGTNFSIPLELEFKSGKKPITVSFKNITKTNYTTNGIIPLCASFGHDGKVTLKAQESRDVCVVNGSGHFGLVVETPLIPVRRAVSRWKMGVGAGFGAVIGAILLVLLLIAVFVKEKKKARIEESERRAYQEEALEVSMVGHVRAPTASSTRTVPIIEHNFRPPCS